MPCYAMLCHTISAEQRHVISAVLCSDMSAMLRPCYAMIQHDMVMSVTMTRMATEVCPAKETHKEQDLAKLN